MELIPITLNNNHWRWFIHPIASMTYRVSTRDMKWSGGGIVSAFIIFWGEGTLPQRVLRVPWDSFNTTVYAGRMRELIQQVSLV